MAAVEQGWQRLWSEPAAPDPPRLGRGDWALVACFFALLLVEVAGRSDLSLVAPGVIWSCLLLPSLLGRRVQPLLMLALAFGGTLALELALAGWGQRMVSPDALAFVLILPYALTRWGSGRAVAGGVALISVVIGLDPFLKQTRAAELLGGVAVVTAALALGAMVRFRDRAQRQALVEVRLKERAELARDLHDTVAHHVSAIAIQAQAGLATAPQRPEAAHEALKAIAQQASATLAEMRAMVQVLRADEPAPLAPPAGLSDLAKLAAPHPDGVAIQLALSEDLGDLLPAVSNTLYRLAQESITNARRHARQATRIEVEVRSDGAQVHLRVSDDGEKVNAGTGGYGLRGMAERALQLGGRVQAGPNPDRGWTVTAVLPKKGPTA
ncbi:MAG: sensor histidine kinase [Deltaproteobacteria bacterium]|nr:sensor histidine kinase [Deltaproteobacteria bacterium]